MNDKLATITNLFEGKEIRSIWDSEKEEYYFSVVDVINALAEPKDASDYWTTLKRRMIKEEKSEIPTNCRELKMKSSKDGKMYKTDTLDTEGIFRLIESVPSSKAEPFKMWLASLGKERIDEVFDPEIAVNRAVEYYRKRGYDDKWIKQRLGKERYNHPPVFSQWIYYISTVNSYYKKEKSKLKSLEEFKSKLKFVNSKDINKNISKGVDSNER